MKNALQVSPLKTSKVPSPPLGNTKRRRHLRRFLYPCFLGLAANQWRHPATPATPIQKQVIA